MFESYSNNREVQREYSKEVYGKKRKELADWIKQLRKMQTENPELAKKYTPPEKLLADFYKEIDAEINTLPFNKEQIITNFSSENLSKATLEEYVELLKKVPPRFITHLTRQGVRDRASFHSGRGEVSNGFEKIIQSGEIKSTLDQYLENIVTKESVKNIIENHLAIPGEYPSLESAASRIKDFLTTHRATNLASSEIADISALHTSMDYIAEDVYGAEPGNEMFFVYPTAYVAANYKIAGQWAIPEKFDISGSGISAQFNDLWIKSKESNAGKMPVDASLVFIPKNTRVNPNTGSIYEINPEGKPEQNTEQILNIKKLIESDELKKIWPEIKASLDKLSILNYRIFEVDNKIKSNSPYSNPESLKREKEELEKQKEVINNTLYQVHELASKLGITDPRFHQVFQRQNGYEFERLIQLLSLCEKPNPFENSSEPLESRISGIGLAYKLNDKSNSISSEEFWENYFNRTGKRPSKIIFYEEYTPNEALNSFKEKAGLSEDNHKNLDLKRMFLENTYNSNQDLHNDMQREIELFKTYAEEILTEIYSKPA